MENLFALLERNYVTHSPPTHATIQSVKDVMETVVFVLTERVPVLTAINVSMYEKAVIKDCVRVGDFQTELPSCVIF